MSKYMSKKHQALEPYVPGEQPKDCEFIKLNTNESPYPPSKKAIKAASEAAKKLQLYSDPECSVLSALMARKLKVSKNEVLMTNGSDEILNFAFMAFCDENNPAAFPDISYGFYKVFAELHHIPYTQIPLKDDFTINPEDYIGINKNIFIANPNAPTGIMLPLSDIERIVASNPSNIVVIDEAYVDFGGESAVNLIHKYDNLIVTQTFSKSRSMAGARLGFGIANEALINDMNTIKYSTNPYNINSMTMAAGIGCIEDSKYSEDNCKEIQKTRKYASKELSKLGFEMTDSVTNFLFAKHERISGKDIYTALRNRGILVRHFDKEKIKDYNRITIGTKKQMTALVDALKEIVKEY